MTVTGQFLVEIDGEALPADVQGWLASVHVDDSLNLPDLVVLRFRDAERVVLAKTHTEIGSLVRVSVVASGSQTSQLLLAGEVTALETEFDSLGTYTVIRGYDPAHRLFRGRRTETYTQVTASDVVSTVGQRAGLRLDDVAPTTTVFDHLSQAGTSDWEFLDGLAREVGHEVAVRDGRLAFRRSAGAGGAPEPAAAAAQDPLVLRLGTDLLRFRAVVTSAEQVTEVQVRGWDVEQKQPLVGTHPASTTSAELPAVTPADLARRFGEPVHVATDVPYRTQAEVDGAAAALAEHVAGTFAEFEGVARGNPELRAGVAITVDGLGAPFDGKYRITTSRHRWDPSTGYTTALAVTGRHERSLLGLASGGPPPRRVPGVVVARVTDVKDPAGQARVRLTFPWLSDSFVSDWARTVHLGAGKDRGALVLPEVGDEVLAVFEQGDVRRPYVLGGLFNGVDTPDRKGPALVDDSSGAVNRRSIVSRRGHRIDLLDEDGRTEGITLATSDDGLRLVLDAAGTTITLAGDGNVLIEGAQGVVVDARDAALDLKGATVAITATTGVTVDGGSGEVAVSTGGPLSLKGAMTTLEGNASTEVKGGASCSISAAVVQIN